MKTIDVYKKIVDKLEYSILYWRGNRVQRIHTCPLCNGVLPKDYDEILLKENPRIIDNENYCRGHREQCYYSLLKRSLYKYSK